MANSKQSIKRARQAIRHRRRNLVHRSRLRTFIKKAQVATASGDVSTAKKAFLALTPELDKLANKGLIHKNRAARYKRRLNARIKKMSSVA